MLVHLPEKHAHTLRAGPDGLDVLAYGQRKKQGNTVLPRAGVAWMHPSWVDVGGPHPWEREAAAGEPEVGEVSPRPERIANIYQGIRWELDTGAVDLNLGDVVGSVETGLSHMTDPAGCRGLSAALPRRGGGALRRPRRARERSRSGTRARRSGEGASSRAQPALASPTPSRGDDGLIYLAYGTREPNDVVYYPRTDEIRFRGVGVTLPAGRR